MTVSIVCFDLDGTLLDGHDQIHPKDLEILRTKQDVIFVPCTGRPFSSVEAMFHRHGLFLNEAVPFPVVTQNGSAIYLPGGKLYKFFSFAKELQNQLLGIFHDFPQATFMLNDRTRIFFLFPNDFGAYWMKRFDATWEPYDESRKNLVLGKATCLSQEPSVMAALAGRLKGLPVELGLSLSSVFDINPQGVSKGTGVLQLLKGLHMQDAPIYAAGDGENDLDLFSLSKVSFAPITTTGKVKGHANQIVNIPVNGLLSPMLDKAGC
jgi:Cof subfamily protein (haloacid dehalogenase superfamily)